MTGVGLPGRDRTDVEALVADRYLDALLAAADRHAADAPAHASLAPELREATRVLRRTLVRVHPSFRFEERLSARLAELAAAQAHPVAATGDGTGALVPFARPTAARDVADPLLGAILAGELDPANEAPADLAAADLESRLVAARRPLIVGGAITSAAISLVGVAWVAWRATHPAGGASAGVMSRVARAAHVRAVHGRTEAAGLSGGGIGGPA